MSAAHATGDDDSSTAQELVRAVTRDQSPPASSFQSNRGAGRPRRWCRIDGYARILGRWGRLEGVAGFVASVRHPAREETHAVRGLVRRAGAHCRLLVRGDALTGHEWVAGASPEPEHHAQDRLAAQRRPIVVARDHAAALRVVQTWGTGRHRRHVRIDRLGWPHGRRVDGRGRHRSRARDGPRDDQHDDRTDDDAVHHRCTLHFVDASSREPRTPGARPVFTPRRGSAESGPRRSSVPSCSTVEPLRPRTRQSGRDSAAARRVHRGAA